MSEKPMSSTKMTTMLGCAANAGRRVNQASRRARRRGIEPLWAKPERGEAEGWLPPRYFR
jgi:hypothetical protein